MRTRIDVCNSALALIGGKPIATFGDGSTEGEKCQHLYEGIVGKCLTAPGGAPFRWSFASTQATLAALEASPLARWTTAWQLPSGCLQVHGVFADGSPIPFDIYGDEKLLTNEWSAPTIDYTFRAEEARWPFFFAEAVKHEVASALALALNENKGLSDQLLKRVDWPGARTADSQQRTARRLRATRLASARFA